MRRRYVVAGFALVAVTAIVGTAVAGIGGGGDGPGAKAAAKKGKRGPRGPAGPAGPQGPPGPPGSAAAFANAAGFASADPLDFDLPTTFTDLVTANVTTSANSILIGTGSVTVGGTSGTPDVECQIEIDELVAGVLVRETLSSADDRTVSVSAGKSVAPGAHSVEIACQRVGGGSTANFQQGNVTATATG